MSGHFEQFGKYILLEKLATGGMAEVFLSRGTGAGGIGKFFAIKRILPQYADSVEFIEMFKDEAKIAINLNHSNIVSIHEFGVEKGQFFLVMDYVEGRNLRQILNKMKKSSTQFTIDQIIYVVKEVAAGLDHAHRCIDGSTGKPLNITHRDMSPQNIMVSFEGEVKIVDFGIAKAESQIESTRAGTLKGKFGYMSPEQAEGQPVDLRTDIFSLGIVLWELLANDRLFVANNEINTLRKIRDCQVPSLRKINPNIHTELERIVQKALARDRNLRYQTAAALHRDLNRFLNRQYPDFSAHDFSVFVKSVFADEILSLRKRLVDYAKVNIASSSMDISRGGSSRSAADLMPESQDTNSGITENSDVTEVSAPSKDHTVPTASETILPNLSSVNIPSSTDSGIIITQTETPLGQGDGPPSGFPDSDPSMSNNPNILDDSALKKAADFETPVTSVTTRIQPIEIKAGDLMDAPDVTQSDVRVEETRPAPVATRKSRATPVAVESRRKTRREIPVKPARIASVATFLVVCALIYVYVAKNFTSSMQPVIAVMDDYIPMVHRMIGVEAVKPTRHLTGDSQPFIPGTQIPVSTGLVVTSNPSGAEIIINDKSTGMVTPSRVDVPAHPFAIEIRKKGYAEYKMRNATRESLGNRLDVNLQKLNIAYLDVEIFPPQPAVVFINGKQYSLRRSAVKEVPIPGNTPVRVRAETASGGSFEEKVVTVPADKRMRVQLNPRRGRSPSSQ